MPSSIQMDVSKQDVERQHTPFWFRQNNLVRKLNGRIILSYLILIILFGSWIAYEFIKSPLVLLIPLAADIVIQAIGIACIAYKPIYYQAQTILGKALCAESTELIAKSILLGLMYINTRIQPMKYMPLYVLLVYLALIIAGCRGGYAIPYDSPLTTSVALTLLLYLIRVDRVIKIPYTMIFFPVIIVGYFMVFVSLLLLAIDSIIIAAFMYFKLRMPCLLVTFLASLTLYYLAAGFSFALAIYSSTPNETNTESIIFVTFLSLAIVASIVHPIVLVKSSNALHDLFSHERIEQVVRVLKDLMGSLLSSNGELTNQFMSPIMKRLASIGRMRVEGQCLVCCQNKANTVFVPCRHSGICKACALDLLQRSSKCAECKQNMEAILVVDKAADGSLHVLEEVKLT